jgi:1-acyl-sn-glycerol-3-phosphate acyltransferase
MLRAFARVLGAAYGVFALAVFVVLFLLAAVLALILPRLELRRAATQRLARLALPVLGVRLEVDGREHLPEESCVVIANHASYLDGLLMKAALPPRFSFVIKREASSMPVVGLLLRRIGSEFVDRHSAGGRSRDASRLLRKAGRGHAFVFFPEGTFDEVRGLKRFHIGAFAAAAHGGMPVVPVVIHGARRAFPSKALLVRPGRVRVEILPPIEVPTSARAADELRATARREILARLDEPDLAAAVGKG